MALWTYTGAGGWPISSRCSSSYTASRLPCTVHLALSSKPRRSSSGAFNFEFKSSAVTYSTAVGDGDSEHPSTPRGQAVTLRPRLQRATSVPPSHPPPAGMEQQLPLRTGTYSSHASSAARRSRAAANGMLAGGEGTAAQVKSLPSRKILAPSTGRQIQEQQQFRSAVGGAVVQPLHKGAALKTGLALTWLGTNSGAPTLERNVSCTLLRLPGAIQMVDCGEGTHRQLMALEGSITLSDIDGIFITHLHGDHCFGVAAALEMLDCVKAAEQADPARRRHHVYGPPGLAELIRVSMVSTGLARRLELPLLVTELVNSPAAAHPPQPLLQALAHQQQRRRRQSYGASEDGFPGGNGDGSGVSLQRLSAKRLQDAPELTAAFQAVQPRVACLEEIWTPPRYQPQGQYRQYGRGGGGGSFSASDNELELSSSVDEDSDVGGGDGGAGPGAPFRRPFVATEGVFWELPGCAGVRVRSAQLQHRVPCWGYVFTEAKPFEEGMRRRKVVVLGDTVSSRPIAPLAAGCDVMSHEATFARGMEAKARIAQHSTGWMAGAFAAAVGARSLVLTHFSARYREGPREVDFNRSSRLSGHQEMEQQSWAVAGLLKEAAATYGRPEHLFAATDFYTHNVPLRPLT